MRFRMHACILYPALFLYLWSTLQLLQVRGLPEEVEALMEMKALLDPTGHVLRSWVGHVHNPCTAAVFEGVACNEEGRVANVSLQGRGLSGTIPGDALSRLHALTALYLHYNHLHGPIPPSLSNSSGLTDLYLNVNRLSGPLPAQLGLLVNLQALQLCCNNIEGDIPSELGALKNLHVLALHHNNLVGVIPSTLGSLPPLTRLDLSFNTLHGGIPLSLTKLPKLAVLDVRTNNLSGAVPPGLQSLQQGFSYSNNSLLCGEGFVDLPLCSASDAYLKPDPLGSKPPEIGALVVPPTISSVSASPGINASKASNIGILSGAVSFGVGGGVMVAFLVFVLFRRHKERIGGSAHKLSENKRTPSSLSSNKKARDLPLKCASPINDDSESHELFENKRTRSSLPSSKKTHNFLLQCELPLSNGRVSSRTVGFFSGPSDLDGPIRITHHDLEELELATNFFSEKNMMGRKKHSTVYKAVLKDGSTVAVRSIGKGSCEKGKTDLTEAIENIAQIRHENLVALRGFCFSSSARGECFLVTDFIPNGTLQEHLDKPGSGEAPLDWRTRTCIARGLAKGLCFMHSGMVVHQNVSAGNILLDHNLNALLSDAGLFKLLADDMIFSVVKTSAAMGYLAPEYGSTGGRLNEKTDIFAFGVILMQLLSGRRPIFSDNGGDGVMKRPPVDIVSWVRSVLVSRASLEKVMDPALGGSYSGAGAMHMASVAFSCTSQEASQRPSMSDVVEILDKLQVESFEEALGS